MRSTRARRTREVALSRAGPRQSTSQRHAPLALPRNPPPRGIFLAACEGTRRVAGWSAHHVKNCLPVGHCLPMRTKCAAGLPRLVQMSDSLPLQPFGRDLDLDPADAHRTPDSLAPLAGDVL